MNSIGEIYKEIRMNCDKCGITITSGEESNHHGQILCEDCYMIALSPMKTCDPWAVHSAKSFEKFAGEAKQLTEIQAAILQILKKDGAMEPATLLEKVGSTMELDELKREFSTLRHMEKVRAEKQGETVFWRLW
jgi:hypothetical protein